MSATAGTELESVYIWVYEPGITDSLGVGTGIEVELGIGPDDTWPDESWTWTDAVYNKDTGTYFGDSANDEYACSATAPLTPGLHDYAARARVGEGEWLYCDVGSDCGGAGSDDGYSPTTAGSLEVY